MTSAKPEEFDRKATKDYRDAPAAMPHAPSSAASLGTDRTLAADEASIPRESGVALASTLATGATLATGDTLAADGRTPTLAHADRDDATDTAQRALPTTQVRTTVLPDVEPGETPRLVKRDRVRYEHKKTLGAGGMGEVLLVQDHDIGREVAVKLLHADTESAAAMARFVDEIRTIGRLEHPNIIPIHDVGIDEHGKPFFVMKYVEGETLESVIEKLRAGDEAYQRKYTTEARVEIFLGVLRALAFAHANGIVHRDIKPANIMVGRYGEVVLMDWGIAKPINRPDPPAPPGALEAETDAAPPNAKTPARLYTTRHAALVGTPAYMSPEQARGANDKIDERSDIYSATVVFHELLGLKHYLHDKPTMGAMIIGCMEESPPVGRFAFYDHPHQPPPPAELMHFVAKGLEKDPDKRFQSVAEMMAGLQDILEGRCQVQCHVTLTKRMAREAASFVDRKPNAAFTSMIVAVLLVLSALAVLVRAAVA